MSKLKELIAELCPNGVEYVKFDKICAYIRGITYNKSKEAKANDFNPWKVLRANNITLSSNTLNFDDIKLIKSDVKVKQEQFLKKNDILICAGSGSKEHIGKVAFITSDMEYTFGGFMAVIRCDSQLNSRYMYHILTGDIFKKYLKYALNSTTINNLNMSVMANFQFPVPPLPVQEEIVRILDSFTSLTAELQTKLQAELQARQKQYEYYRNQLLEQNLEVQRVSLKAIVKHSCSGGTPKKSNLEYYDNGQIPWIRTQDVKFNEITEVEGRITEKAIQETSAKWIPENCVIVAISGATAGRCAINKIKAATNQHCLNMEIDETKAYYRYVFHVLCSKQTELFEKKQGARGDLNASLILALTIPLPSLEVQKQLANLLDNFDAICSDLNIGLPDEIEARQKQYEYYRDALLSFNCSHSVNVERERERVK